MEYDRLLDELVARTEGRLNKENLDRYISQQAIEIKGEKVAILTALIKSIEAYQVLRMLPVLDPWKYGGKLLIEYGNG